MTRSRPRLMRGQAAAYGYWNQPLKVSQGLDQEHYEQMGPSEHQRSICARPPLGITAFRRNPKEGHSVARHVGFT